MPGRRRSSEIGPFVMDTHEMAEKGGTMVRYFTLFGTLIMSLSLCWAGCERSTEGSPKVKRIGIQSGNQTEDNEYYPGNFIQVRY